MGSSNSVAKASPQGQGGRSSHAANNSDQWKAVCTSPDYCKVGNSVVPFDSYADIGRETKSSPDVMAQGLPVYRVGDLHHGVKADAGRHIVCGTSLGSGYVQFLSGHDNVKVNGLPVVRHGSLCRVNCDASGFGGAPGQVVTPEKTTAGASSSSQGNAKPNAQLQALLDKAADGRSVWEKTGDFFSGAWDSTKRLASASYDSPGNAGAGFFKGIGNLLSDMWNLGTLGSKYAAPLGFPNQATIASYLEGAALTAYQAGDVVQANNLASRASEMMSSGYVGDLFPLANDAQKGGSILSAVVPVGAAAKGLATTAKAVRGANAAGAGADAARAADGAADLVKGAEGADVASDTAKASGGGLGVHVQPMKSSKFTAVEFKGRRIYKNSHDIDPGKPGYVDPSVDKTVRAKLEQGWTNKDLMEHGLAPIGPDGKQINLHHLIGKEPGPMIELTASTHQRYYKPLHGLIEDGDSFRNTPSLKYQYKKFRGEWWKQRSLDFQ